MSELLIGPEGEPRPGMQAYLDAAERRITVDGKSLPAQMIVKGALIVSERRTTEEDVRNIRFERQVDSSTGFPEPLTAVHGVQSVPISNITTEQLGELSERGAYYAGHTQTRTASVGHVAMIP